MIYRKYNEGWISVIAQIGAFVIVSLLHFIFLPWRILGGFIKLLVYKTLAEACFPGYSNCAAHEKFVFNSLISVINRGSDLFQQRVSCFPIGASGFRHTLMLLLLSVTLQNM